jgi:hypothetical protein
MPLDRTIFTFLAIVISSVLFAQPDRTLIQGEFFVDHDPGVGNGTAFNLPEQSEVNIEDFEISVDQYSPGFHQLGIRTKDSYGNWGFSRKTPFYVYPEQDDFPDPPANFLIAGEYFIDEDPGVGSGIPFELSASDSISIEALGIALNEYGIGFHDLFIRLKDSNGNWGLTRTVPFYIYMNHVYPPVLENRVLVEAEYWIDEEPVPGTGSTFALDSLPILYSSSVIPSIEGDPFNRLLHVRVKDSQNQWSLVHSDTTRNNHVTLTMSSQRFIREQQRAHLRASISNSGSSDYGEYFVEISTPFKHRIDLQNEIDTLGGIFVGDITSTVRIPAGDTARWVTSIWIGKLSQDSEVHIDMFFTVEDLPGNFVDLSASLRRAKNELYIPVNTGLIKYWDESVLFKTQKLVFDSLEGYLNDPEIFPDSLNEIMLDWYDANQNELNHPLPWSLISSALMKSIATQSLADTTIETVNREIYLASQYLSFMEEPADYGLGDDEMGLDVFKSKTSHLNYNDLAKSEEIGCDPSGFNDLSCNNLLVDYDCINNLPSFRSPLGTIMQEPILTPDCFWISSTMKLRCYCECSATTESITGTWSRQNRWHNGYDITLNRTKAECRGENDEIVESWKNYEIPVRSVLPGTVTKRSTNSGLVQVDSELPSTCGDQVTLRTKYYHLDPETMVELGFSDTELTFPVGYVAGTGSGNKKKWPVHLHIEFYIKVGGSPFQLISPSCLNFSERYEIDNQVNEAAKCRTCLPYEFQFTECGHSIEFPAQCDTNSVQDYSFESRRCPSDYRHMYFCIDFEGIGPTDPNSKRGLTGYTENDYISGIDPMEYTILFENVDTATASAQVVFIKDTIDLTKFDLQTFKLKEITAGSMWLNVDSENGTNLDSLYEQEVNGCFVKAESFIDEETGILEVVLTSIDPVTLEPTTDPLKGFLPPDTTDYHGNGTVTFEIAAYGDLDNNDTLSNRAAIIFDTEEAILTNTWMNLLDKEAPQSSINPLPPITTDSIITLNWSIEENESGIRRFQVFVKSGDDPEYMLLADSIQGNSLLFYGNFDEFYSFYSLAIDSVGNVEEIPQEPDATVYIESTLNTTIRNKESTILLYPNPTEGLLNVRFKEDIGGEVELMLSNTLSQRVSTSLTIPNPKNNEVYTLDVRGLENGLYFLTLRYRDFKEVQRFVIQR